MAAEKAFLVPVVVDATTEPEALVPTQFRDVQWTRIRAGEVPAAFVDRIAALINQPVARHMGSPERNVSRAPARRPPIVLFRFLRCGSGACDRDGDARRMAIPKARAQSGSECRPHAA